MFRAGDQEGLSRPRQGRRCRPAAPPLVQSGCPQVPGGEGGGSLTNSGQVRSGDRKPRLAGCSPASISQGGEPAAQLKTHWPASAPRRAARRTDPTGCRLMGSQTRGFNAQR